MLSGMSASEEREERRLFLAEENNRKAYRENISNEEIFLNIFAEIKDVGYLKSGNINIKDI